MKDQTRGHKFSEHPAPTEGPCSLIVTQSTTFFMMKAAQKSDDRSQRHVDLPLSPDK